MGLAILALGLWLLNPGLSDAKPSWVHDLKWQDKPDVSQEIEELLWNEISPYRTEYETVNISSSSAGKDIRLKVTAFIKESDKPDIYEFSYQDGSLLMTGYLLEAIPVQYRDEAVSIALSSSEISSSPVSHGTPTVRRILPHTSMKFYAQKTLLSVTWDGISALVDPEEGKVANVWNAGSQQGQKS